MSNKVGIRKQPVTATYVGGLIFLVKISENYCEIVQTKSLVLQTKYSIKESHMGTFALTQRPVPLFAYVLTLMEPPFPLSVNVIIECPLLSSCIVPYCLVLYSFFDVKKQRLKTDIEECNQCSVSNEISLELKVPCQQVKSTIICTPFDQSYH